MHPITAYQMEWSLFYKRRGGRTGTNVSRTWHRCANQPPCAILTVLRCRAGIVAYSPLGRGFLTGTLGSLDDFPDGDYRKTLLRFSEYMEDNLKLVEVVREVAAEKGCTPGQVALAWVHARGEDVFPIPGTKKVDRFEENLAAFDVQLTTAEMKRLEEIGDKIKGTRYSEANMGATYEYL